MIVKKLGREALVEILENMVHSPEKGFGPKEVDRQLIAFCLNCPDPAAAMDLVIDAPRGISSAEIVGEALAMPKRAVETWSESELAKDHPLRRWKLEE